MAKVRKNERVTARVTPELASRFREFVAEFGHPWDSSKVLTRTLELLLTGDVKELAHRVMRGESLIESAAQREAELRRVVHVVVQELRGKTKSIPERSGPAQGADAG